MTENNTVVAEAYRLAELRLQAQFEAAIAADQRAVGVAGMLVAAAAILTALANDAASSWGMLLGATGLACAALLAWFSARPQSFYVPGACFDDLEEDMASGATIEQVMRELGAFNDKHSRFNHTLMKKSSHQMRAAFYLAIASVVLVMATQAYAIYFSDENGITPDAEVGVSAKP